MGVKDGTNGVLVFVGEGVFVGEIVGVRDGRSVCGGVEVRDWVGNKGGVGVPVGGARASITAWLKVVVKSGVGKVGFSGLVTRITTNMEAINRTTAADQYRVVNVKFRKPLLNPGNFFRLFFLFWVIRFLASFGKSICLRNHNTNFESIGLSPLL